MDKIATISIAVLVIAGIVWWFFNKRKSEATAATREGDKQVVEIVVDGGYTPGVVQLEQGAPADLVFIRKDKSACFEEVVLPDSGARAHLPVDQPHVISINPEKPGEYQYACGMNMFFGKVIVK